MTYDPSQNSHLSPEEQFVLLLDQRKKLRNERQRNLDPEKRIARNKRISKWKKKNRDKLNVYQKAYREKNKAKKSEYDSLYQKTHKAQRKKTSRKYNKKKRKNDLVYYLLKQAKQRSKDYNLAFSIDREDIVIPEYCPVLGIKLFFGNKTVKNNSPTVDKIIPALGYVKGNVRVISYRANHLKNNATLDEAEKIYLYIKRETERILGK